MKEIRDSIATTSPDNFELYEVLLDLNAHNAVWSGYTPRKRLRKLKKLKKQIAAHADSIAETVARCTHRPVFETMTQEILPVLEMARYCSRKMPSWLRSKYKRYARPGFAGTRERLYFKPYGTVALIMPANFPFSLGMMSVFYLAAAGNTVILKPSERLPAVTSLLRGLIHDSGIDEPVIQITAGGAETVNTLIDSDLIHKVFFFGNNDSGEQVRQRCFNQHIPCVLETGGGTAAVIDNGISISRTAAGIAWSTLYTRGHSCIGTRLLFVDKRIKEIFLRKILHESSLVYGEYDIPLALSSDTVAKIGSAVERGAKMYPVFSGYGSEYHGFNGSQIAPGILEVEKEDPILQQELFDPILVLCPVDEIEEAIPYINRAAYLMGASVWTRDRRRAQKLIRQLNTSMNWINDTGFGLPNLPWGGSGKSGQGVLFSRESLHEAGTWKWIIESPGIVNRSWWHPYTLFKRQMADKMTHFY